MSVMVSHWVIAAIILTLLNLLSSCLPYTAEEDMMDSSSQTTPPGSPYSQKACFDMLDKVCPDSPLPKDCESYPDVTVALQRRNSDRNNHNIAFAGMNPGEAAMARAARERGMLNHSQIQRRMTQSRGKKRIW